MKKKMLHRIVCFALSVTMLLGALGITSTAASLKVDTDGTEKYPYTASTLEEMQSLVGTVPYDDYISNYDGVKTTNGEIISIDITSFKGTGELVSDSIHCSDSMNYDANSWLTFGSENADKSVYLPTNGSTTWSIEISEEQAGMYYIQFEYYSCNISFGQESELDGKGYESSVSSIERKFYIDGRAPFNEVKVLTLGKNWVYDNVVVSDPVPTTEKDNYIVEYDRDGEDGYVKIVTDIKDGMKTVTTYTLSRDIIGNSMSPELNSVPDWSTYTISDASGYHDGYFEFYIADGTKTFTLEAEREPMIIKSISLIPVTESVAVPSFDEVLKDYKANGYKPATNGSVIEIQAEFPDFVSDASVAPTNDSSSAANFPTLSGSQVFNVIGENGFNSIGQWAAYKFKVSESGLYNISSRFKQSALQGMFICRTIKLSGGHYGDTPTVPYAEAFEATFGYDKDWQSSCLSSSNGIPFQFYFEEGVEYTLYLECSLGALRQLLQSVERTLNNLNSAYLAIIQYTGASPDEYRSYRWEQVMPEVLVTFGQESQNLMKVKTELEALCGTNGSHIATLETVAILLNTMGDEYGYEIAANLSTLKSYLGTLGTWINDSKSGALIIDSLRIAPLGENGESDSSALAPSKASFFKSAWHEITAFFKSFTTDYNNMGLTKEPDEDTASIDVWLALGRDQSQIWRTMIDAHDAKGFTYNTGTAVALKLVVGGSLLPSILARKGPDVYMGLDAASTINYAIRGAVLGVSGNDVSGNLTDEENAILRQTYYIYRTEDGDYIESEKELSDEEMKTKGLTKTFTSNNFEDAIAGNFAPAAMNTLRLIDVYYGIPQTMGFAMMFYRMDVLADLCLEVPESWDELLSILPSLQSNNMSIGVAYISALDFMIYQKGGSLWKYTDESLYDSKYAGAKIDLDSDIALEAFEFVCRLYSDYSFPVSYDSANRFRTGEMPIVIGDYASIYNTLVVFGTEIEGLWEFCSLPGSKRADGTFNYDSLASVSASIMLKGADVKHAWQYMQWQTGESAQSDYGNRIVSLIGPSAKYESANLNAINNMSWTSSEKAAIMNQMEHLSSIVNYPGSYIYTRYMQFAFLDAVNEDADPIDAMTSYINAINSEITRKRKEFADFGIWYAENLDDEPPFKDGVDS